MYVSSSNKLKLQNEFTVMTWVYQTQRSRDWVRLIGKGNSRNRNYGIWVHPDGRTLSQIYGPSGGSIWPGSTLPLNTWTHFALTFQRNYRTKFYINGSLIGQRNTRGAPRVDNNQLTLGGADFHAKFYGKITNSFVLDKYLTQNQIQIFSRSHNAKLDSFIENMRILPGNNSNKKIGDEVLFNDKITIQTNNLKIDGTLKRSKGQQCPLEDQY